MVGKQSSMVGLVWCMTFLVLDAAQAVWFGGVLQSHDSFQIGFLVFGFSSLGCLIVVSLNTPGQFGLAFANPGALLGMNLSAVGAWVCYFFAIQRIEPAIAFMIFSGMIPLTTIATGWLGVGEGERSRNRTEAFGNGLLFVGMVVLAVVTLTGHSGFVRGDISVGIAGLVYAVAAGAMIAAMLMFSQRLDRRGMTPIAQFGLRFPLYLAFAFFGWQAGWDAKGAVALSDVLQAVAIGMVLLAFPIYAVQKAVAQVSSLTLAAIAATGPVLVFAFQMLDDRVTFAPATSLGLAICFSGALIAAFGAGRNIRRNRIPVVS